MVVQYAPFQKTPPKKIKPDPLAGTIDDGELSVISCRLQRDVLKGQRSSDAEYQAFVKSLTEPEEPKAVEAPETSASSEL